MDCASKVGVAILAKIGEYTVAPVGRQLGYLVYYKSNVTNLETQVQQLRNAQHRLQHAVDEATRDAEGIEDDVQEWLCKVCETVKEAEGFIQHQRESNFGHCSLLSRHQLSRKASKMAREIHQLKEDQITRFNKVSYRLTLQSAFKNKLYKEFESRKDTLNGIMEALRDPKLSMVVVYGPGGIGKTMLVEEIARQTLGDKLFSMAIMVSISHIIDVEKVQQEIAEMLDLELEERSLSTRAERIQRRLEQEKEILLILDDVWVKFDLADIGISFGDDQKGCKILVTSRFQHLLFDDHMDSTKNFQVGFLSNGEATDLFNRIVGNSVEQPDFKILAPQIIKECARLPIVIATVASALRNKNLAVWNDALRQLRSSIITEIEGMEASVYKSIKLSYDFLRSEESQLLLLFCSLREEDAWSSIEMLLKYGIGWSLFQDVYKLDETRDRVYALLDELQARSLLKEFYYAKCVKVHDIVRDCALSIASKERKMHHICDARQLKRVDDKDALKNSVTIFLVEDLGEQLPERLECPNLKFLFFSKNSVPDQFFREIKDLRVLSLERVPLEKLPSSICVLQNLRTLCIIWSCHQLLDIALIGELKSLEFLSISGCTALCKVPKEIGQLTRLRLLDLNKCTRLKIIESNVISKLINLEELNLREDRIDWGLEGGGRESSNASLTEVKDLAHLSTLYLEIEDMDTLSEDFFSEKLDRYEILIGYNFDHGDLETYKRKTKRTLQLRLNESKLLNDKGLEVLLKKSEVLYLDGLEDVKNFVYEVDAEGFQQVKCLVLQNSNGIKYLVNSMEKTHPCSAFQSLEFLRLRSLIKLKKICHGDLPPESFTGLKVIQVNSCDKLRNLFHYSVAKCLSRLETIKVSDCEMMEEIVISEGQVVGCSEIIFPQLRSLELKNVPKLSRFTSKLVLPQSSTMSFFCGKFADPTSFMNLRELVVEDSYSLKYLFSSSVAENLLQLNRLEIRNCGMMEEIIAMDKRMDKLLFPKLSVVMLENLPKLKRLCSGAVLEFPLLAEIKMKGCPESMASISISENKSLS